MARAFNINSKQCRLLMLFMLGIMGSISFSILGAADTLAQECTADSQYSCVTVVIGKTTGNTTVRANEKSFFQIPITINTNRIKQYTVKLHADNDGALINMADSRFKIPSVRDATSWSQFGTNGSEWGIRFVKGTEDSGLLDYQSVPATPTSITGPIPVQNPGGDTTDYYTLGVAVAASGEVAAGSYSNTVTVSVVANPLELTIFDIDKMQEMTPEICAATTQPYPTQYADNGAVITNAPNTAIHTDIDGTHAGDRTYVPQATLTDVRDGKTYVIRKLADGNCWMSSNLRFDILGKGQAYYNGPTSEDWVLAGPVTGDNYFGEEVSSDFRLTADDTDLHSTNIWDPEYFKSIYAKPDTKNQYAKVYATSVNAQNIPEGQSTYWDAKGDDGLRSFSYIGITEPNKTIYSAIREQSDPNKIIFPNQDGILDVSKAQYTSDGILAPSITTNPQAGADAEYGNLYNWTAATLGSGYRTGTDGTAMDTICPKGWTLPVRSDTKDHYINLIATAYGINFTDKIPTINKLIQWPFSYMFTGIYPAGVGTAFNNYYDHRWFINNTTENSSAAVFSLNPVYYSLDEARTWRGDGFPIRCVAR